MAMMGGAANRQTDGLLDLVKLLTDPEAAAKTVKEHKELIEAHRRAKLEAETVLKELKGKQAEHDERETMVSAREQAVAIKIEDLHTYSDGLDARQAEINSVIAGLGAQRKAAQAYYDETIKKADADARGLRDKATLTLDWANKNAADTQRQAEATLARAKELEEAAKRTKAGTEQRALELADKEYKHKTKVDTLHTFLKTYV